MPKYSYQARSNVGAPISGFVEAISENAVASQLMQQGAIPLFIEPVVEQKDTWAAMRRKLGLDDPGIDDLILFSRQCHALNKAGVPIIRGFRLLAESYRNPVFAEAIEEIADKLEAGNELSVAMSYHPKIFSPLYINMIRVGETSGRLDEAFLNLHFYYERDRDTVNQIKAAFRYPLFVFITIIAAFIILMTFVIPKFAIFYLKNGMALPLPTRIIMWISNFMSDYWILLVAGTIFGLVSFRRYVNTEHGRLWWDEKRLNFIVVGSIALRATLSRFARTLAMALASGVPILQSISVTAKALGNEFVSSKVIRMKEAIERGESLYRASAKQKVFTPIVLQMIAVGEESGRIDEMLLEIAEFYEREVDYDVRNLNAVIEPILTIAMAGLVLLLMLGVFLPMWNVVDLIK